MRSIDDIDVTDRKSRPCRDIDSTSFAQKQGRRIDSISLDIMSDHVTLLQLLYDITSEWPETLNTLHDPYDFNRNMVRRPAWDGRSPLCIRDRRGQLWHVHIQIRRTSAGNVRLATLDGPVWQDELPVEREPTYRKGFEGWPKMSYCYPFRWIGSS